MYDINFKNVKKGKGYYQMILILGIIPIIVCLIIFICSSLEKNNFKNSVKAYSIEDNCHKKDNEDDFICYPVYYYKINNVEYTCRSSIGYDAVDHDNNKVFYDRRNPSKCVREIDNSINSYIVIGIVVGLILILIGLLGIRKVNKRIRTINKLNTNGTLIKNVPYSLKDTFKIVKGKQILKPVVDFILPNGNHINLEGDERFDFVFSDEDGMVDVLIDLDNVNNYYIDFEINRLRKTKTSKEIYEYSEYLEVLNGENTKKDKNEVKGMSIEDIIVK